VALFRAFRARRFAYHMLTRSDPDVEKDGQDVELSGKKPKEVADRGDALYQRLKLKKTVEE
jgi:hypothetical protein